ncbi:MAG: putative transposase, partial [bacterium]
MNCLNNQPELDLRAVPNTGTILINGRCTLKIEGTVHVVYIAGLPMHHWTDGDRTTEAYAMVSLVRCGYADQNDVARCFGCSTRTLRRYQRCFETGGMSALGRPVGPPHGARSTPNPWVQTAKALRRAGVIVRDIAHRLGVSKSAVSKWLTRLDKPTPTNSVADTSQDDGSGVVSAPSLDTDPKYRLLDRLLARLGKLDDADPIFTPSRRIPRAGVLLAVPALTQSGIFSVAEEVYGHIGPAFYGLRTTMMAMLLMALLRIKRPEGLKESTPVDLGRVLGLDRGPEVKTLRR